MMGAARIALGVAVAVFGQSINSTAADDIVVVSDVAFQTHDGLTIAGKIFAPTGHNGRRPGMLLVHGSGNSKWEDLRAEADGFAQQGIVVLVVNKRTVGYSFTSRNYSLLVQDALAAFAVLRERPEVDRAKVGIWGLSEGGWVAPMAAARQRDIAFLITVGASGVAPLRQETWSLATEMARAGIKGSLADRVPPTYHRFGAEADLFSEAYHDPVLALSRVSQPVLALWGADDRQSPPAESAKIFQETFERGGNTKYTIKFFAGTGHSLHQADDQGRRLPDSLATGYAETVGTWVRAVVAGQAPGPHADPAPEQAVATVPLSPAAWWESWQMQSGALAVILVSFIAYPMVVLIRRLRGRSVRGSRSSRLLVVSGLGAIVGFFGYVGHLVTPAAWPDGHAGPIVAGRPVAWLVVQVSAVTAVLATGFTAYGWPKVPDADRVRIGTLLAGGLVFTVWAVYWGLLLP